jgi:hypothetical protein
MAWVLLITLGAMCLYMMLSGLSRADRIYQFPFLIGCVFFAITFLEFVALCLAPGRLPSGALARTGFVANVSLLMCVVGDRTARKVTGQSTPGSYDLRILSHYSMILTGIGAAFFIKLLSLPTSAFRTQDWSGLPVAYIFLCEPLFVGFALAYLIYLRTAWLQCLLTACIGLSAYLVRIILHGRRAMFIELAVIIGVGYFFTLRRPVSRMVVAAGIVVFVLLHFSAHEYRMAVVGKAGYDITKISEIEFAKNLKRSIDRNSSGSMENAAYYMAAVDKEGSYGCGLPYWNAIIQSFVPRQWVGEKVKRSLMLDTVDPPRLAYRLFGYVSKPGVPGTGLSDSFASFSYFGSGVFFLLALYFGRLYRMALLGDLRAQMFYVCLLTGGLHTATHTTTGVIPAYMQ